MNPAVIWLIVSHFQLGVDRRHGCFQVLSINTFHLALNGQNQRERQ